MQGNQATQQSPIELANFLGFGKPKTVDSVMATFNKAVADLEEVHSRAKQEAQDKAAEAEMAMEASRRMTEEADRAASVRQKLLGLMS